MLLHAPKKCIHHPDYEPGEEVVISSDLDLSQSTAPEAKTSILFTLNIALLFALPVFLGVSLLCSSLVVAHRHRVWLRSLEVDSVADLYEAQEEKKKRQRLINAAAGPMVIGEGVPTGVRWLVPLMIIASTGLFCIGFFVNGIGGSLFVQLAGADVLVFHQNAILKSSIFA